MFASRESHEQPAPNEYQVISDITAKCQRRGCGWQAIGSLKVEINSGETVVTSQILKFCRAHHDKTRTVKGSFNDHNQFFLFQNGEDVGFASVSSGGSSGTYDLFFRQKHIRK